MKKYLLLYFCLLYAFFIKAQTVDTVYLNAQKDTIARDTALYYRIAQKLAEQNFLIHDYYTSNNQLESEVHCVAIEPQLFRNGKEISYFENGNKASEGNYLNNKKRGSWINWDEDGKDSSVTICNQDNSYTYVRLCAKQTVDSSYNVNYPVLVLPKFPGGEQAMMQFIHEHIVFPISAIVAGSTGISLIGFVVEKDGELTHIKAIRGLPGCPQCDDEAIRVIKKMPRWYHGTKNGKAVSVQYTIPIKYTLLTDPN